LSESFGFFKRFLQGETLPPEREVKDLCLDLKTSESVPQLHPKVFDLRASFLARGQEFLVLARHFLLRLKKDVHWEMEQRVIPHFRVLLLPQLRVSECPKAPKLIESAKWKRGDWNSRSVGAWKLKAGPSPSGSSGESTGVEQL